MAENTSIEWTQATWNPVTGCSKVSIGCAHCYAERMALRLQAMGLEKYINGFKVTLHPGMLTTPLTMRKPHIIFVNSMSDLFHYKVPLSFIQQIFDIMRKASWHQFQVLTKRADRLAELAPSLKWTPNIWMGVTVESARFLYRLEYLRSVPANIRFLSMEPFLGPVSDMDLTKIDWVIVGGESGRGARPMLKDWVIDIQQQCLEARVPFFFKQWGGVNKKKTGRCLDGKTFDEMPMLTS